MASATPAGTASWTPTERSDARRHATSGPTPMRRTIGSPNTSREEVVGRAHGHGDAAHRLGEDRVEDAPEDGERERDEEEVVVEERRLARDERFQPRARAGEREPDEDERGRPGRDDGDEPEEPSARSRTP